jgi:nitroreductase
MNTTTSAGLGITTPPRLQDVEPRTDNPSSHSPVRLASKRSTVMDPNPDGQAPRPVSDLERLIGERRSTRMFLPHKPVPRELVDDALALAVRAPSNSNIQPWQMVFASGAARDRLVTALLGEALSTRPKIPALPEAFAHLRRELGAQVYGSMGIAREDAEGRRVAVLRNWEFFRAPLAGIVCIHRDLGPADYLGVGMFLQTLLLALTAQGLGTCVQVSIAGYPEIIHKHLDIPAEYTILCGLAVGYPDPHFPANKIRTPRKPIDENVVFLDK